MNLKNISTGKNTSFTIQKRNKKTNKNFFNGISYNNSNNKLIFLKDKNYIDILFSYKGDLKDVGVQAPLFPWQRKENFEIILGFGAMNEIVKGNSFKLNSLLKYDTLKDYSRRKF